MFMTNSIRLGSLAALVVGSGCSLVIGDPTLVAPKDGSGGEDHGIGGKSEQGSGGTSNAAGSQSADTVTAGAGGSLPGGSGGASSSATAGQIGIAGDATYGGAGTGGSTGTAGTRPSAAGTTTEPISSGAAAGGPSPALSIEVPKLPIGRTGEAFSTAITASGAASYAWTVAAGALPRGIVMSDASAPTIQLTGVPSESGQFLVTLDVTDGTNVQSIDILLEITHKLAFLSDRATSGVIELFAADVGTEAVATPIRMNSPLASGEVTDFGWSPDGTLLAYSTANEELRVASVASPGTATLVGSSVESYLWLTASQTLAFSTPAGRFFLVDVSGAAPWENREVILPSLPTGELSRVRPFRKSPIGRACLVEVSVRGSEAVTMYYVNWPSGASPSAIRLASYKNSPPAADFSSDGTIVLISGLSTAAYAHVVSGLESSAAQIVQGTSTGARCTSSPISNAALCDSDATGSSRLSFNYYSETWQSTYLVEQSACDVSVGPWSPNGQDGLFKCGHDLRGIRSIASAVAGSDFSLLPDKLLQNSFTAIQGFDWSPDSNWIALTADDETDGRFDLHLVRWSTPGVATKPYDISGAPGVLAWKFAPDSSSIAFVGAIGGATLPQLFLGTLPRDAAPEKARGLTDMSSPAVQDDIFWLPGSRVIVYRANDSGGPQLHAVQVAPAGQTANPVSITGPSGAGVKSYQLAPPRP